MSSSFQRPLAAKLFGESKKNFGGAETVRGTSISMIGLARYLGGAKKSYVFCLLFIISLWHAKYSADRRMDRYKSPYNSQEDQLSHDVLRRLKSSCLLQSCAKKSLSFEKLCST